MVANHIDRPFNDTMNWHAANMQQIHQTINMWHDLQMSSMQWKRYCRSCVSLCLCFLFFFHLISSPCFTKCGHSSIVIAHSGNVHRSEWSKVMIQPEWKTDLCEMAVWQNAAHICELWRFRFFLSSPTLLPLSSAKLQTLLHPIQTIVILFIVFWLDWNQYPITFPPYIPHFFLFLRFNNSCWALLVVSYCSFSGSDAFVCDALRLTYLLLFIECGDLNRTRALASIAENFNQLHLNENEADHREAIEWMHETENQSHHRWKILCQLSKRSNIL